MKIEVEPALRGDTAPVDTIARSKPGPAARLLAFVPGVVFGALMLVSGLVGSAKPYLDWDEIATVDVARRTTAQIWALMFELDAVFTPYYLFMHWWMSVAGDDVLAVRLPTILAMAVAVGLAAELARRLFGVLTAVITGALLCLTPILWRFATEARPYAFACMFSMIALLVLFRMLDRPRWTSRIGYPVTMILLGLSHFLGLLALAPHLVIVIRRARELRSWRPLIIWFLLVLPVVGAMTPLALLGLGQRDDQISWVQPLSWPLLRIFPGLFIGSPEGAWVLLALIIIAAWRRVRRQTDLLVMGLLPIAIVALLSLFGLQFWVFRYLLFALAPLAIVAALGLARIVVGSARPVLDGSRIGEPRSDGSPLGARAGAFIALRLVVLGALFLVITWPGHLDQRGRLPRNGSNLRATSAIIRTNQLPGDVIVYEINSRIMRAGTDYYLRDDALTPTDVLLQRSAAEAASLWSEEYTDIDRVDGYPRIWVLVYGWQWDGAQTRADLRPLLAKGYRREHVWHNDRVTLALYARRTARRTSR